LELHLHPTLQQEVLLRFQKTFPQIQFIISTHSPLIISNQKADGEISKIIKLENDGDNYTNRDIDNIYGIDYSTNLSEIMEVAPRSTTIDKYINAYLFLYGKRSKKKLIRCWKN
jgi:predicted ATP-binding protein involved in virulence